VTGYTYCSYDNQLHGESEVKGRDGKGKKTKRNGHLEK